MTSREENTPWYRNGLHFKCTECGQCCTGSPGYVWITDEEAAEIAASLKLELPLFYQKYTRLVYGRRALLEKKDSYDCIFLEEKRCRIYKARPKQCRTYPWWPGNLTSEKQWKETAKECEGIRPDAPLVTLEEITRQISDG